MGGEWGRTIIDGELQYVSASAMTLADPNSYGGCPRRYHFKYAAQKKEPTTKAMTRGTTELHAPIEHYYKTGQQAFTPLVLNIRQFLYERNERILIEQQMAGRSGNEEHCDVTDETQRRSTARLRASSFRVQGVPIVGKIDLMHAMGVYIDAQGELRNEPNKSTIEVLDWKSTKAWEYAKSPHDLANNIQMDTYDQFARHVREIAKRPTLEFVRRSHVYSLTGKGEEKGRKVSVLADREHSSRRWEYVGGVVRLMLDVAKVPLDQSNTVDGNPKACEAYRGCPHAGYCTIGGRTSLFSAAAIMQREPEPPGGVLAELANEGDPPVSLLKKTAGTAGPTVTQLPASQGVGVSISPGDDSLNMIDQLLAEEETKITGQSAASLSPEVQKHRAVFDLLQSAGLGEPTYSGVVAAAYYDWAAARHGMTVKYDGKPLPGHGKLAGLQACDSFERLLAVGADIEKYLAKKGVVAKPAPAPAPATVDVIPPPAAPPVVVKETVMRAEQPISILPEETPESDPAQASVPVEGFSAPSIAQAIVLEQAAEQPVTSASLIAAAGEPTKTRKPRAKAVVTTPGLADKPVGTELTVTNSEPAFVLYYDCMPTSVEFEALQPLVDKWCAMIADYYKADPPDMRCAQNKPLSFGGWKGVLFALVVEEVTNGKVPRARWFLRSSEINDIVCEAMHASTKLDDVVRGLR